MRELAFTTMLWKKRKRHPLSAFSVMCLTCGAVLLLGNLYMMQTEFVQGPEPRVKPGRPVWIHPDKSTVQLPLGLLYDLTDSKYKVHLVDPKLRKLMEEGRSGADERDRLVEVPVADLRRSLALSSDCRRLNISHDDFLASGWTKAVYQTSVESRAVAVKTVAMAGHDMAHCLNSTPLNKQLCYAHASQKILTEILLLRGLSHPNIIKSLGHCVSEQGYDEQNERTHVTMTTELGESIDIIKLLQMSWEDRLRVANFLRSQSKQQSTGDEQKVVHHVVSRIYKDKPLLEDHSTSGTAAQQQIQKEGCSSLVLAGQVAYGLTRLLTYLAHSPYGSLSLNDFRRQQFVLVEGEVKLSDVDDVGFLEPRCNTSADCDTHYSSSNFTLRGKCINGRCEGSNEKRNIFNAARHFTTFLLPHGAPGSLRGQVDRVVSAFDNVTASANQLLSMMEQVVDMYRSGVYLYRHQQHSTEYKCVEGQDLAGMFDYRCRYSIASVGCTLSVFDHAEAEQLCNDDPECKAYVLSPHSTWTGRMIIHLKNNVTTPTINAKTTLCFKPKP